ncbi:MAG TPA: glycosyltransferase family 2 protein [Chitinispirillaceae bacterium]|nr:glycosyltransferase family 2 protein [Chitinispirillaceae bacterium]
MNQIVILIIEIIFWISIFLIGYSYFFYPFILIISEKKFRKPVKQDKNYYPSIGVLVPVHNEEKVITKKIQNILSIDYPSEKLEIWVGSDNSSDKTDEIVRSFTDKRIKLWVSADRVGKTGILNRVATLIETDIVLFTDANTFHNPDCLKAIARNFADPHIGGVAGHIKHVSEKIEEFGENIYRKFESKQKYIEGGLHSTISAFGGFYAIRKKLFSPIPDNAYSNDDVLIPMNVIRKGYRVIYEPEAVSQEDMTGDVLREFSRRVRIGAGNFQAFFWLLDFLNPFIGWPSFCYISHKVTRWFSPFFLLFAYISCGFLFYYKPVDVYRMIFAAGSIILLSGCLFKVIPLRITRHIYYFLVMNIALTLGFFRYLRGIESAAWARTERS